MAQWLSADALKPSPVALRYSSWLKSMKLGDAQLESLALGVVFRNVSGVGVVPLLMCRIVLVTVVHLAVGILVLGP